MSVQRKQCIYLEEKEIHKLVEDDCCKMNTSGYD